MRFKKSCSFLFTKSLTKMVKTSFLNGQKDFFIAGWEHCWQWRSEGIIQVFVRGRKMNYSKMLHYRYWKCTLEHSKVFFYKYSNNFAVFYSASNWMFYMKIKTTAMRPINCWLVLTRTKQKSYDQILFICIFFLP